MVGLVVVAAVLALVVTVGLGYDRRDRRRGAARRRGADIVSEAIHHRIDINALPYEPARHAGQRDWATYRRRDRKHR